MNNLVSILILLSLIYIFYKIVRKIYKGLIKILGGEKLLPIDENHLAVLTRAKFDSLSESEVLKFVMDRTGWNFERSKAFCDKLKPRHAASITSKQEIEPPIDNSLPKKEISKSELEAIVREKLAISGKLQTVKYVVDTTGWTLKDSKDFCDKIQDNLRIEKESENQLKSQDVPSKLTKSDPVSQTVINTNSKEAEEQISYIISKTGWSYAKAKAYFKDIQTYERELQRQFITK